MGDGDTNLIALSQAAGASSVYGRNGSGSSNSGSATGVGGCGCPHRLNRRQIASRSLRNVHSFRHPNLYRSNAIGSVSIRIPTFL